MKTKQSWTVLLGAAALSLAAPLATFAATPTLETVLPRGGQRGTEVEVTFKGNRLVDAREVFLYQPGITVEDVKPEGTNVVHAKFKIAADAALGEHTLRMRTASGISELRNFYVGPFTVVDEAAALRAKKGDKKEPVPAEKKPSTFESPQKIDLNVTVAGVIENEQADYYAVDLKKGQRLTAEVEGMRLGEILDTYVAILDTSRFELATCDDDALLRQDALASVVAPRDGTYIIQVRESSYGGGANAYYRMHVGTFPRPRAVYPAGGKAGEEATVKFIGDALGTFDYKFKIPDTADEIYPLFAQQDGITAPSPNVFRVSSFPNVMEVEPNDEPARATPASGDLPLALNGIIDKDHDADFFKFKATKGQVLDINVYGRRVRSPLDSVLTLHDAKGNQIAANDDNAGPDSYLRFSVPADGEYIVGVTDHLKRGGPDFVYRIEITPVKPSLLLAIPNMGVNYTQDRQAIAIPKGGRYGTTIRATRAEFGGDLKLLADHLPPGVTMHAEPILQGIDMFAVVFEADAAAPVGGTLAELTAKCADEKINVPGQFRQVVELSQSGNNAPFYTTTARQIAVSVDDEAPFKISVVQPKVPVVQSGIMELKVVAERKPDFKGPIEVKLLWEPPGVGSGTISIAPDKTEGILTLNAQGGAKIGKWKTAVVASADVAGPLFISSSLFDVDVAAPFLTAQIQRANVLQGQTVPVTVKLEQKVPFDGPAKVELLGLPQEATTAAKEITKGDTQVVFDVATTAKTPAATHNTLQCQVTVRKDGEPIIHTLAQGGVLRVDAPKVAKPDAEKPKPGEPAGPSRLEKLRLEKQGQKK